MKTQKSIPKWLVQPPKHFRGEAKIHIHGDGEPQIMKILFVHKSKPDALAWWAEAKKSKKLVVDLLQDIVAGFIDEEGNEQPATKEDFAYLLDNFPTPYIDLVNAWFDHLIEGRLKN